MRILYAEINTKSDYCHICGFDGEILNDDDLNCIVLTAIIEIPLR